MDQLAQPDFLARRKRENLLNYFLLKEIPVREEILEYYPAIRLNLSQL